MDQANAQFAFLFVIATIGMLTLAISIIIFVLFYQKRMLQEKVKRQDLEADFQKKMLKAVLDSQEKERRRLAGDLHDSVGAMLSTIKMGISTLARTNKVAESDIESTKHMLDETIESVRSISRDLMPSTLEKFGLTQAISEMCERVTLTAKLPIQFEEVGQTHQLEKSVEVLLYRIVQELINNILKHAGASKVEVRMDWNENLRIVVVDNGVGFDYAQKKDELGASKGLGLYNMENRAQMMGANLRFESPHSGGTMATIEMMMENA